MFLKKKKTYTIQKKDVRMVASVRARKRGRLGMWVWRFVGASVPASFFLNVFFSQEICFFDKFNPLQFFFFFKKFLVFSFLFSFSKELKTENYKLQTKN